MKNPFKNFKTKRKLREEIAFLEGMQHQITPVLRVERNIVKINASMHIEDRMPADFAKRELLRRLTDKIAEFTSWDVVDTEHGMTLIASVYVSEKVV